MALALVVQLTAPAMLLRARAAEAASCLALSGGSTKSSDHIQTCLHCPTARCGARRSNEPKRKAWPP
jgi:hypothetical protein